MKNNLCRIILLPMLNILFAFSFLLIPIIGMAETVVEARLKPYQQYLENGTYDGHDWSSFPCPPKSRFDTFVAAFEQVAAPNKVVVELGTTRSFTHGGHPGCNSSNTAYWTPHSPENWDWGAGFFTRMAATALFSFRPEIHTVDCSNEHIWRCMLITKDFQDIVHYHVCTSEDFLKSCSFPYGIDLLYLDTGDMTPLEPTAQLHLREASIIVERDLIAKDGYILIDDVKSQVPKEFGETSQLGKAKYSLPYFLEHGFELVMDEYQVLLRKM